MSSFQLAETERGLMNNLRTAMLRPLQVLSGWIVLSAMIAHAQGPSATFRNDGPFTIINSIDAGTFINTGNISYRSVPPASGTGVFGDVFETLNTLTYTNIGSISASPGFFFQNVDYTGRKQPANVIFNAQNGVISASGQPYLIPLPFYPENSPYTFAHGGYLMLSATNIVNRGLLSVSFSGDLLVEGQSVDLKRSALINDSRTEGEFGARSGFPAPTPSTWTYRPPTGTRGLYWLADFEDTFAPGSLAVPFNVTTTYQTPDGPVDVVTTNARVSVSFIGSIDNPVPDPLNNIDVDSVFGVAETFIRTNVVNPTNQTVDAIFVVNNNPNVLVSANLREPSLGFGAMSVTFGLLTTNNANSSVDLNRVRVSQYYTSLPTNIYHVDTRYPSTMIPRNFIVDRLPRINIPVSRADRQFIGQELEPRNILSRSNILYTHMGRGNAGDNETFRGDLFTTGYFMDFPPGNYDFAEVVVVTNIASYAFEVTPLPSLLPVVPGVVFPTNSAGRIRINAENLELQDARIRAQGTAVIKARNVVSSRNTSIAAPAVWYELGATNGTLVYQGMNPINQPGLNGTISTWTTSWVATAEFPDPNATDPNSSQTVQVQTTFRVMFVQGRFSDTPELGTLSYLKLNATNLVINDPIAYRIPDPISVPIIDGYSGSQMAQNVEQVAPITENLVNNAEVSITGTVGFSPRSFPRLLTVSNSVTGDISSTFSMTLGTSQRPLNSINNDGRLTSSGAINLNAAAVTNRGEIDANGPVTITGSDVVFDGAFGLLTVNSGPLLSISGSRFQSLLGGQVTSDGIIDLDFSESFTTDPASVITFHSPVGIRLARNAAVNNLEGVNLSLEAARFQNAFLSWAGADVGTEQAGFSNNSAVASLILEIDEFGFIELGSSVSTPAALYVRRLELGAGFTEFITNGVVDFEGLASVLDIPQGMRVYYNTVSVDGKDINPTLLDGAYDGRLRLIADPSVEGGSLVFDLGGGFSVSTSWGVRYSTVLDSDGDGIPNASDASPFSGAVVSNKVAEINGRQYFEVAWNAAANTSYEILAKDSATAGSSWERIGSLSNTTGAGKTLKFYDPMDSSGAKTYRIVYKP